MLVRNWIRLGVAAGLSLSLLAAFCTQGDRSQLLWDSHTQAKTSSSQVHVDGRDVVIDPGEDAYPGVTIEPATPWDLSAFGHIEARIRNTGATPLGISLRVDNPGDWKDNPWNAESTTISAGQVGTVSVMFGYSYGLKPGFKLDSSKVVRLLLFVNKPSETVAFHVDSLTASGPAGEKPAVAPGELRIKPADGYLFGNGAPFEMSTQVTAEGATVASKGNSLTVRFTDKGQKVTIRPPQGAWDLRETNEVAVACTFASFAPTITFESKGGSLSADLVRSTDGGASLVAGYTFLPPIDLQRNESQVQFTNDAVTGITLTSTSAGSMTINAIRVFFTRAKPSATVGQGPPAEGKWIKTLDDEFDGTKIDDKIWNVAGENYYDKVTHWSKDEVIVGDGVARLRYEKKRGFQNDDPKRNETGYAAGYLDTYGKFTQKYGYFEARMKLPKAPGLWPAFWMMPDRGPSAADQGKRQFTGDGAMEFDIMEHLTRWGGMRYNIAMHYDGYEKDHKALGSDKIYVTPDKDGFLTCGLLWEPGKAVFYCNGHEVLRWENPRISNVPSDLMFTLPSGGWDNDTVDDAKLPADFVIDYVRVWKRR